LFNLIRFFLKRKTRAKLDILKHAYEDTPFEIALYDLSGHFLFLSKQFFTNGMERSRFIAKDDAFYFETLKIGDTGFDKRRQTFIQALTEKRAIRFTEKLHLSESGKTLFYKRTFQPLFLNGDGSVSHMVLFGSNLTAVILSQQELKYLAFHDKLTGLGNRDAFNQRLEQMMLEFPRWPEGQIAAVLFCDLDNFKLVNDSLGHDVGDLLLKEVSARIDRCLRKSDFIFRLGGDEFTVLLHNLKQDIDAGMVAEKLIKEISRPYLIHDQTITYVTVSIGIALFPKDGSDRELIVTNADLAMYEAKRQSKNNYKFFSKGLTQSSKERLKIVKGLKELISKDDFENQFKMVYQPIYERTNNKTFSIVGSEALLRWQHPHYGPISPDLFIPVAEESNLIQQFGKWIFERSLRDFKYIKQNYAHCPLYISINLSAKQLSAPKITDLLYTTVKNAGIQPEEIQLEITETSIIDNSHLPTNNLFRLSDMGFRLAIDDFGEGFASLSYLQKIPASVIKIDKTFIQQSLTSTENRDLVKAIILLSRNLKKEVIAEGVEKQLHLDFLLKNKCYKYQGFYFSKPLDLSDFDKALKKNKG